MVITLLAILFLSILDANRWGWNILWCDHKMELLMRQPMKAVSSLMQFNIFTAVFNTPYSTGFILSTRDKCEYPYSTLLQATKKEEEVCASDAFLLTCWYDTRRRAYLYNNIAEPFCSSSWYIGEWYSCPGYFLTLVTLNCSFMFKDDPAGFHSQSSPLWQTELQTIKQLSQRGSCSPTVTVTT